MHTCTDKPASLLLQSLGECQEVVSRVSHCCGKQPPVGAGATTPAPAQSWQHQENICSGAPFLMEGCSLPEQSPKRHKGCCRERQASSYGNGESHCKCRYSGLLSQGTGRRTGWPESKRRKPFLSLWRSSEHSQLTCLTENPPSPAISSSPPWPTSQFSHHFELHRFPCVLPMDPQNSYKSLHGPPCQPSKASSDLQLHIYLSLTPARPNFTKTSQNI